MTIRETFVFIHKPISAVVDGYRGAMKHAVSVDDDEVAYLFGGSSLETAEFALSADFDAPDGQHWTHLLHPTPQDLSALAKTLISLEVDPDQISPATDWDGKPLVKIDDIRAEMQPATGPALRRRFTSRWRWYSGALNGPLAVSYLKKAAGTGKLARKLAARRAARRAAAKGAAKAVERETAPEARPSPKLPVGLRNGPEDHNRMR